MTWLWIALALAVAAGLLVLFSPVVVSVDTDGTQMQVRWMALRCRVSLAGGRLETQASFAGLPLQGVVAKIKAKVRRSKEKKPGKQEGKRSSAFLRRVLRACAGDAQIRRAVARQTGNLARGVLRSVELSNWESDLSLPDPAWNGMLAGLLAQQQWKHSGKRCRRFGVNFTGENRLQLEARFYPHRTVKALCGFFLGLPYRAIYRQSVIAR